MLFGKRNKVVDDKIAWKYIGTETPESAVCICKSCGGQVNLIISFKCRKLVQKRSILDKFVFPFPISFRLDQSKPPAYNPAQVDSEYTIVVPDADVLSCVCGTNDNNLKLIERHLGTQIFTRGNELSVETDDARTRQEFRFIIDRVIDEIHDGGTDGRDIIACVLNTERKADAESSSITVPGALRKVYPHSQNQADYVALMRKHDLVFCSGAAGSGKTFLAVAEALRLVLTRQYSRLILSRPVVEAGESLGFLPGDFEQKINPYLRPLYDAMDFLLPHETARRLTESGVIETAPLAYMRGRTLNNAVIILDEAQNATASQMKMFLTRMGQHSKVFVTGDVTQVDLPKKNISGLTHALSLLNNIEGIGVIYLTAEDVVRNHLVKKIVKAYENEQNY